MKSFLFNICLGLCLLLFVSLSCSSQTTNRVSPKALNAVLSDSNIQLIDVRTPNEFNEGHIENAQNINFFDNDFVEKINKLNKEKPVYLYCRSGKRSANSAVEFEKLGFVAISDLEGGILNWKSEGYKVVSD